jgi:hypothetical protein
MNTLVIGGRGSAGSRYCAILKSLDVPYEVFDLADEQCRPFEDYDFTHAIIATPTPNHLVWLNTLCHQDKTFLCEKPVSKMVDEIVPFISYDKGYVVNNYAFCLDQFKPDSCKITYDYFRTGSDGVYFDCVQLLYLDLEARIRTNSPIWEFWNHSYRVHYHEIEQSYIDMVQTFLGVSKDYDKTCLWDMKVGLEMTKRAILRYSR